MPRIIKEFSTSVFMYSHIPKNKNLVALKNTNLITGCQEERHYQPTLLYIRTICFLWFEIKQQHDILRFLHIICHFVRACEGIHRSQPCLGAILAPLWGATLAPRLGAKFKQAVFIILGSCQGPIIHHRSLQVPKIIRMSYLK